jgi:CheY-like chemotaxis protein
MHTQEAHPPALDVLLAEDDDLLRTSLRWLLEGQGYSCAEASNGQEAIEVAQSRLPQCVVLDLVMPGLDGLAVARRLRADPRTRGSHIHCMTGYPDEANRQAASAAGCERFLTKPLAFGVLLDIVRQDVVGPAGRCATGLTLRQAGDLLDWLQNNGHPPGELSLDGKGGFSVRYRVLPPRAR